MACGLATEQDADFMTRTINEQMEKVKEATGVEVPKYYNPAVINPLKYAEQVKKRKMLWAKPGAASSGEEEKTPVSEAPKAESNPSISSSSAAPKQSFNKWEATNFGNNQANEKFRRLMGIKAPSAATSEKTSTESLFSAQEQQYEKARAITHTQRGLGLGFASGSMIPDNSQAALARQLESATQKKDPSMLKFVKH